MTEHSGTDILFVINPGAGTGNADWPQLITSFFASSGKRTVFFHLTPDCTRQMLLEYIQRLHPHRVVAVGGDGTLRLVASCLLQTNIRLGILPAGSANGMAKELGISNVPVEALAVIAAGVSRKIHVTHINNQLCIHLSDIGFNAYAMKGFETQHRRGMWGYVKACMRVWWKNPLMDIDLLIDEEKFTEKAAMIVIANGTTYGSGAVINPIGKLDDGLFEVIVVKKISVKELWKMTFSHAPYDLAKTALFQTSSLVMRSTTKVYFQVDGEYLGKVREVKATILKDALDIIVPA